MVQSVTLQVYGNISDDIMEEIKLKVTPVYLRTQLRKLGVVNIDYGDFTSHDLTNDYKKIPNNSLRGLTLYMKGNDFKGLASGRGLHDRLIIKVIALKKIQEILKENKVSSEFNFSDVANNEYVLLSCYKIIRNRRRKV